MRPPPHPRAQTGDGADYALEVLSWTGVLLSLLQLLGETTSPALPALLWCLHVSLLDFSGSWADVGGWGAGDADWLTLELGFLAMFLYPLSTWRSPFPPGREPPRVIMFLVRWCAFRALLGAGMANVGASGCWKSLWCDERHQLLPLPTPLAWYAHHLNRPLLPYT